MRVANLANTKKKQKKNKQKKQKQNSLVTFPTDLIYIYVYILNCVDGSLMFLLSILFTSEFIFLDVIWISQ